MAAGTPAPSGLAFRQLVALHGHEGLGHHGVDEERLPLSTSPRRSSRWPLTPGTGAPSCRAAGTLRRIPPARLAVAGGRAIAVAGRRAARDRRLPVMVTGRLSTRVRNSWAKLQAACGVELSSSPTLSRFSRPSAQAVRSAACTWRLMRWVITPMMSDNDEEDDERRHVGAAEHLQREEGRGEQEVVGEQVGHSQRGAPQPRVGLQAGDEHAQHEDGKATSVLTPKSEKPHIAAGPL